MPPTKRIHRGGCHCKAVRFELTAEDALVAWDCNCSICRMKRNTHVFIAEADFHLLSGADNLSCYQFETGVAKHLFCKTCGICCHYRPRSNPDTVAVTVHCIDADTPLELAGVRLFNGVRWEESFAETGIGRVASSAAAAAATAAAPQQQESPAASEQQGS